MKNVAHPVLHLNLKRKWFDMILCREKTVEYREARRPYWFRVFGGLCVSIGNRRYNPRDVLICFSNGYAKDRDQFLCELRGISYGRGLKKWGAVPGVDYFKLELGKIYIVPKGDKSVTKNNSNSN